MVTFKKGDLVRHKAGGPIMFVTGPNQYDASQVACRWPHGPKNDQKFREDYFDPEELELVPPRAS
jgi:uncharacterized protein YodC (DUF2158 family)